MKDKISENRLAALHPAVKTVFRDFINACEEGLGITLRITQGLRTIEEQQRLYETGRTRPGKKVTNAPGGASYHNYGLAIDLAVLDADGKTVDWNYDMAKLKPFAQTHGIEWGGDWHTLKDRPHFQMTLGYTVRELRSKVDDKQTDQAGYVLV